MLTTWRYRIKDSGGSGKILNKWSRAVNFVWNFCKDTQITALQRKSLKVVAKKDGSSYTAPNFLTKFEVREWTCPSCNMTHDRDVNAARNILRMGRHTLILATA
jgi:hypothetical protein